MESMYSFDDSFTSHDPDVFSMLKQITESVEVSPSPYSPLPPLPTLPTALAFVGRLALGLHR